VSFKPGGGYALFGVPLSDLRGRTVSVEDLIGRHAWERLAEAALRGNPKQALYGVEQTLSSLLARSSTTTHDAVVAAVSHLQRGLSTSIADLVEDLGLSHRRFVTLFKRDAGLTPKRYQRVQRFQRARDMLDEYGESVDWLDIAFSCGYYDQSHFIRDWKSVTGLTPTELLEKSGEMKNHVEW
jgi:AraC-like DNA-binding protein